MDEQRTSEPVAIQRPAGESVDVERWSAEVVRLREMIDSLRAQQNSLIWFVRLGPVLALPTLLWRWWAPLVVVAFALTTYFTGQYFSWGHLVDRRAQLRWAERQRELARAKVGTVVLASDA